MQTLQNVVRAPNRSGHAHVHRTASLRHQPQSGGLFLRLVYCTSPLNATHPPAEHVTTMHCAPSSGSCNGSTGIHPCMNPSSFLTPPRSMQQNFISVHAATRMHGQTLSRPSPQRRGKRTKAKAASYKSPGPTLRQLSCAKGTPGAHTTWPCHLEPGIMRQASHHSRPHHSRPVVPASPLPNQDLGGRTAEAPPDTPAASSWPLAQPPEELPPLTGGRVPARAFSGNWSQGTYFSCSSLRKAKGEQRDCSPV